MTIAQEDNKWDLTRTTFVLEQAYNRYAEHVKAEGDAPLADFVGLSQSIWNCVNTNGRDQEKFNVCIDELKQKYQHLQ